MIAIVIPYYKLSFFKETLDSLKAQTNQKFKVYIGDDASPENPDELLEKYKGKINFDYYRFENNLGGTSLSKQWERCIALTKKEEWIMILGDDDVLGLNAIEEFYNNLNEIITLGIQVVRYSTKIIDDKEVSISENYEHPKLEKAANSYFRHFSGQSRSSLSEYIFSRKSFETFGFTNYPLGWHSDDKAWLDFSQCGNIFSINSAVIDIRISNQSISGQQSSFKLKRFSRMKFLESVMENYIDFFTSDQKKVLLFEYGNLIKEFDEKSNKKVKVIFISFLKMGFFYDAFRFLRRMYIIKN